MNSQQSNEDGPGDPRVRFAAERTLLAWIRTGLAMMGFGFVVARFGVFLQAVGADQGVDHTRTPGLSLWIGSGLILLGVVANALAAMQHAVFLRQFRQGKVLEPPRWSMAITVSLVLSGLGIGMLGYLLLLP